MSIPLRFSYISHDMSSWATMGDLKSQHTLTTYLAIRTNNKSEENTICNYTYYVMIKLY